VLGVEAHIGSIVPKPKLAAQLVESVPGLTLTLDYTHFTRVGLSDDEIEPLVKYAGHFHVRGARKGRLQAPFKDNTIDYARVLKTMNSVGYPGSIVIRWKPKRKVALTSSVPSPDDLSTIRRFTMKCA
jgi:sugar phosphate isomerase/epimerase